LATTNTTCNVSTCAFHHPQNKCAAGEIQVKMRVQQACCDTFIPRDEGTQPASGDQNPEIGMKVRMGHMAGARGVNMAAASHIYEGDAGNLTPLVACSAENCQYNQHGVCFAENMIISGDQADNSTQTHCSTYSPA